jgi:hypothetical protein
MSDLPRTTRDSSPCSWHVQEVFTNSSATRIVVRAGRTQHYLSSADSAPACSEPTFVRCGTTSGRRGSPVTGGRGRPGLRHPGMSGARRGRSLRREEALSIPNQRMSVDGTGIRSCRNDRYDRWTDHGWRHLKCAPILQCGGRTRRVAARRCARGFWTSPNIATCRLPRPDGALPEHEVGHVHRAACCSAIRCGRGA